MLRLISGLMAVAAFSSCAELSVQQVCHQQTVQLPAAPVAAGMQHVVIESPFQIPSGLTGDANLKLTFTLNQAELAATTGTLPYVSRATLSLIAPPNAGLQTVEVAKYQAQATTPVSQLVTTVSPVDALPYASEGQLDGQLALDVDAPTSAVETTLEVCGSLSATYQL